MKNLSFIAAAAAFAPIVEREYEAAVEVSEDNPRLHGLGDLGNLIAACLAQAPAKTLADLAAKSVVMKLQIAPALDGSGPHECCCEQERLAWSMAEDAMRLAEMERGQ